MAFYDLPKPERAALVEQLQQQLQKEWEQQQLLPFTLQCFSSNDTYIRRSAYLVTGRIYQSVVNLRKNILQILTTLSNHDNELVRQTCINAAGEIGKLDFTTVQYFFDKGILDPHHKVRNAVIGSVKKMGAVNPGPVLQWAQLYLQHPLKEIRREICHGIELRGREHPEEILPLLQQLEHDNTARVKNTLVHVIGQIAYKKGCLATVISHLQQWENSILVRACLAEIIDVHDRYKNFAHLSQAEATKYIKTYFPKAGW